METRKLSELKPDRRNANRGRPRGDAMIERSLRQYGAGRSILLDKHGTIIAGNKTIKNAKAAGMQEVIIVPSDGRQLVAVQRTDLDLESDPRARELAIADNRTSEVNLEWDAGILAAMAKDSDLSAFFSDDELAHLCEPKAVTPEDDLQPEETGPTRTALGETWRLGRHQLLIGDSTDVGGVHRILDIGPVLQIVDPPFDSDYRLWRLEPNINVVMVWQRGGNAIVWEAEQFGTSGDGEWGVHELVFVGGVRGWPLPSLPCTVHDVVRMWRNRRARKTFDRAVLKSSACRTTEDGTRPYSVHEHAGGVLSNAEMSWGKALIAMELAMSYIGAGEVVWDPCAGSGTSLIAAEKHGRIWRGAENQPRWGDLILRRWEKFSGQTAERE